VLQLLATAKVVPRLPILVTLIMVVIHSSKLRFLQEPYGGTSQRAVFFAVTSVNTANLTCFVTCMYDLKVLNKSDCQLRSVYNDLLRDSHREREKRDNNKVDEQCLLRWLRGNISVSSFPLISNIQPSIRLNVKAKPSLQQT
jgi:hypothetical protein